MNSKTERISIVYNPVAGGGGSYGKLKKLVSLLEDAGNEVGLYSTREGDQPLSEADFPEISKTKKVVIAGGDGSLNKVVNQIFDYIGNELLEWEFAVFPIGSGNDWARAYGFSKNPEKWFANYLQAQTMEAPLVKLEMINTGKTKKFLALNSVGIGVTGDIMKRLHRGRSMNPSKAAYLATTLKSFYHYDYPEFTIGIDKQKRKLRMLTANLGLNLTTGGGMCLFPQNKNAAGLGFTLVNQPKLSAVPALLWQIYFGDISKAVGTVECHQPKSIEIFSDLEQCMEIDGEMHFFTSCTAYLFSGGLKVFGRKKK